MLEGVDGESPLYADSIFKKSLQDGEGVFVGKSKELELLLSPNESKGTVNFLILPKFKDG